MDRRRFIPLSLEKGNDLALEPRTLLSTTAGLLGAPTPITNGASNLPQNLEQRLQRIANLPFFMTTYQPNRSLPASVSRPIQDDLRAIISHGHSAPKQVLLEFNRTIRSVDGHAALTANHASALINAFHSVLANTGISDPVLSKFTEDMRSLAKLDSNGPNPTILATNDFALITQLVQAVAQPFAAPGEPTLRAADKIPKSNHVTHNHLPTFIGSAPDGVLVRIVNADTDQPIGVSLVTTNGRYSVTSSVPLPDGTYRVQAQTLDNGYESVLSHRYVFTVVTPTVVSRGPRG